MSEKPIKRTLAQDRIAKGLCPRCGEEAAPYRLCQKHRDYAMMGRFMGRLAKAGAVTVEKREGKVYWRKRDLSLVDRMDIRPFGWDLKADDKRRRPRLGGIPADVQTELLGLIADAGRSVALPEIMAAWGKLRETRRHGSIAGNLSALIEADRRRQAKAAKRLRHVTSHPGATP